MQRLLTCLALSAAAALLLPSVVAGSCRQPPPLVEHVRQAESVFVGRVIRLENENRRATIAVSEVWSGPDLAPVVTVRGGLDAPAMMTSVDREFELDTVYLFAVRTEDGRLTDNACSATLPWGQNLAALRPSDARPPLTPANDGSEGFPIPLAVIGLTALLVGGSLLAFRTRS